MKTPAQIQTNYIESFDFGYARKKRQVQQLVLLNNLQRGEQTIASTLLLTLFNRTMAALYDDKLQVKFLPSQGLTQDQINAYNTLAQSDYIEMDKAQLDYDWVWDTLFFGAGYCETYRFDKKQKILKPTAINPLVFGYDPYFEDVQDWRYYWKWLTKSKYQIDKLIASGKITGIKSTTELPGGIDPYLWEFKARMDAAKKAVPPTTEPAQADVFQILEYFGYNEDGKKCVYWVDKDFSKVLFEEELKLDDMEGEDEERDSKWPLIKKESFRMPHSSVPLSIADVLEDKHRAKSVLLNLAYIAAKDIANPTYLYNPDVVKDVAQFFSRQINQHIPVNDITTAVAPLNTKDPMPQGLINFITMLQAEANDPIGTGVEVKPQSGSGDTTATEAAIDQQLNDMAQSLASKVMQFGEKEFWSHWFHRYALNADELESKLANIVGVKGIHTSEIDLKEFKADFPPGVFVFSAKEAEYKNLVKRRDFMQLYPELAQSMEPDGFRNFQKHVFMPLMLEDPSLIDIMYPKTLDEMKAEEENDVLKHDEWADVLSSDDHTTHLYTHAMVQPKTWAVLYHMRWHEDELAKQKQMEKEQAQAEMQGAGGAGAAPKFGAEKKSPLSAAAPLKAEARPKTSGNIK